MAAAGHAPELALAGLDRNVDAIAFARSNLRDRKADLRVGELTAALPWRDGSFDRMVCHNVLECLVDPLALVDQAVGLLAPGGLAVWSHTDSAGFMVAADDHVRNMAVLDAYAGLPQPWMDHANPRMGRELPGLLAASPLQVKAVNIHNTIATDYVDAEARILEIDAVLRTSEPVPVPLEIVDGWRGDLDARAARGQFFFAEPTVVVTTYKPA